MNRNWNTHLKEITERKIYMTITNEVILERLDELIKVFKGIDRKCARIIGEYEGDEFLIHNDDVLLDIQERLNPLTGLAKEVNEKIEDVLGQSVLNSDNIKRIYGKNRNES